MKKKLIEVALPLEVINNACKPETENPFLKGHPRALHTYWARIPLVACRAVLFGSLVDDPTSDPDRFPTEEAQEGERRRLCDVMERLCTWDATTDQRVLEKARAEVAKSIDGALPMLIDPFAGRGSIPLEAARLGLPVGASDLNPVAVLISRGLLQVPSRFASHPTSHPDADHRLDVPREGLAGLREDLRHYGTDIQRLLAARLNSLYPESPEHGALSSWLWARTVRCQNPGCRALVPLVTSFVLSKKKGREAWIHPEVGPEGGLKFTIRRDGTPTKPTKAGRGARFRCLKWVRLVGRDCDSLAPLTIRGVEGAVVGRVAGGCPAAVW